MMDLVAIVGVALVCAILAVIIKQYKPEFAPIIVLGSGVLLFAWIVQAIVPIIDTVTTLMARANFSGTYAQILLKCLGICYITKLASDVCQDAGQSAIAGKMELAGKVAMLLISMPLFLNLIEIAIDVLNM